ncbi:MAG TPA: hypothetical protein VE465_11625 [Streptosporangiaceae bacterium]|jgi:hypothetical protein|nr:hypothetical protein [Streptosporangiaceae bacterium]
MTSEQPEPQPAFYYHAFGLPLKSSFLLPGLAPATAECQALFVQLALDFQIERLWSGADGEPVWTTAIDGRPYTMRLGREGDYLMTYGRDAVFLLSADLRELRCSPARPSEAGWRRFLLDTVLWSASLLRGVELMHASAVQGAKGVTAFAGFSGGGKTSLACEVMRRGASLFTDDIVALPPGDGDLCAHPGPALMNLPRENGCHDRIGDVIERFPDEDWVTVPGAARQPDRLAAVCLLRRRSGAALALRRLQPTVLDLLPFSLGFPHLRARLRQRFAVFARLAAEVPVYELSAPVHAPPQALADLIEPLVLGPDRHESAA